MTGSGDGKGSRRKAKNRKAGADAVVVCGIGDRS
jgi:hypothetical protein